MRWMHIGAVIFLSLRQAGSWIGVAACLALGATGCVLGTRFLVCEEAVVAKGYQDEILRFSDGGVSTVKTVIYDVGGVYSWVACCV